MKIKKRLNISIFIFVAIATLLVYAWFANSSYFPTFKSWVEENIALFVLFLFLVKVAGIVWPPLGGGVFTLGAIPLIGWVHAYLIDFSGSMVGAVICYYLGRKYGEAFLHKVFDERVVRRIKAVKVKKNKEIEAIFVYRMLFGFTIIEAIYYGAGLLKIGFKNFLIGAVISHLAIGVPSFLLIQNVFDGKNLIISALSLLIAVPIFLKFKSRYFE
ncbi:VTT domain-containing protein [Candidatus Woesebacteria bacterium]|nr:VTT domain-containing protein [Candidatus Woesebacteria bacterium]